MYDADKPVPLNGTVTAVQWRAPHVFVFVDAKDEAVCVAKDGSHTAAAQFVTVPSAFENHRVGLCKSTSR